MNAERVKCILPHRTSGCGEKLNYISTCCGRFYAASAPDHGLSQSYLVEDVEVDLLM
jgi:hypothetical protein